MNTTCCANCFERWDVCKNRNCPCHRYQSAESNSANSIEPTKNCLCGGKLFPNLNHHTVDRCYWQGLDTAIDTGDWRERFDSEFLYSNEKVLISNSAADALKAFIAREKELSKADGRAEEAINCHERVERAREEAVREHDATWHPIVSGKVQNLHDFEAGLKKGQEEGRYEALTELAPLKGEDGKLFSRVIAKAMEAPFVEVALQHIVMRVAEKYEKAGRTAFSPS